MRDVLGWCACFVCCYCCVPVVIAFGWFGSPRVGFEFRRRWVIKAAAAAVVALAVAVAVAVAAVVLLVVVLVVETGVAQKKY